MAPINVSKGAVEARLAATIPSAAARRSHRDLDCALRTNRKLLDRRRNLNERFLLNLPFILLDKTLIGPPRYARRLDGIPLGTNREVLSCAVY